MRWLIGILFIFPAQVYALDIGAYFLENCDQRAAYVSPLNKYASDECPNLTAIASCLTDTGFGLKGDDGDLLMDELDAFKNEGLSSCKIACDDGDFGACAIHGATKLYGLGDDSPSLRYEQVRSLERACEGGISEVCGNAGQEMQIFWIAKNPELLNQTCQDKTTATQLRQCLHARFVEPYIDEASASVIPPTDIFSMGCAQNDVTSCRLLIGFHIEYASYLDTKFDADAVVEQVCAFSAPIQCKYMKAKLSEYEALNVADDN